MMVGAIAHPTDVASEDTRVTERAPDDAREARERAHENEGDDGEGEEAEPPVTPIPERWLSRVRRCQRRGGRRWCDGPRRVPEPHGRAAAFARELGIGGQNTASRLLTGAPRQEWVDAVEGHARETLFWPVDGGRIGRTISRRRFNRYDRAHNGLDIPARGGTPVRAANDGLVVYSNNGIRGMGNVMMLLHVDGSVTISVHLRAAYLFPGQQARRGQIIGTVGTTGISQGNHLHFEWRKNGVPQDPIPALVGIPLDDRGLPAFARPRPLRHAARFRGFEHLAD